MPAHSLGFMLPLLIWVPAPMNQLSSISQQPCLHSCPLSPCFLSTLAENSALFLTATKLKQKWKLPQRICTHWGFYWRCAVMQDAYSTALQTMYILMLDPYLSWRVLGHSVNKSHVIFAWLSSILPVSLTSSCFKKKKKSFHFYRKFHSLLSLPLGWTLPTPKASAHPATSAPGLTPSSSR